MVLWSRIQRRLIDLNLFESGLVELKIVREERWSTRLYIILLLISFLVLIVYTALGTRTIYVVEKNPSVDRFLSLQLKYSDTLKCPCSQSTIRYEQFIEILDPVYHQVRHLIRS